MIVILIKYCILCTILQSKIMTILSITTAAYRRCGMRWTTGQDDFLN